MYVIGAAFFLFFFFVRLHLSKLLLYVSRQWKWWQYENWMKMNEMMTKKKSTMNVSFICIWVFAVIFFCYKIYWHVALCSDCDSYFTRRAALIKCISHLCDFAPTYNRSNPSVFFFFLIFISRRNENQIHSYRDDASTECINVGMDFNHAKLIRILIFFFIRFSHVFEYEWMELGTNEKRKKKSVNGATITLNLIMVINCSPFSLLW